MRLKLFTGLMLLVGSLGIAAKLQAQPALDPARFEADIMAFEAMDAAQAQPTGAIVLTGSSSIARWNQQSIAALAPLTVIPRGFGGSVMGDLLHYLDRVALVYQPRAILIYEGDNDTFYGVPVNTIAEQFDAIVARVHETLPQTRIYILAVKPSLARVSVWNTARQASEYFRLTAEQDPLITFVDMASPFLQTDGSVMDDIFVEDGLHLNDKGNAIWGAVIKQALMVQEAGF